MIEVVNLSNGEVIVYSCSPEEAVIAAYAQSLGDQNTWDYDGKYDDKVVRGELTVSCGNFTAIL